MSAFDADTANTTDRGYNGRVKLSSKRKFVVVLSAALMFMTIAASAGAALPPGGTFTDDDGNTHEGNIEAIAAADITKGCNPPFNDEYCPDQPVGRDEMAAFIRRALSLPYSTTDYFTDDDGSTFEADINAIAQAGITKGCNPPANDHYCPDDAVGRDEMAAFIRRAKTLPSSATDYFTDDDGSTFEADINAIAQAGITKGCNPPANDHYCPDDAVDRDEMASFLSRMEGLTAQTPPSRPPLSWQLVADGLDRPIQVMSPPGEDRLLIAQQNGLIQSFDNGALSNFLDLRNVVSFGGERGLLSMAFHPDYPTDRRMFVWYFGPDSRTHLVEYQVAADLNSASSPRSVLSVAQPAGNHNGGFVDFGPDGYLYLGLGDGGGGNDAYQNARNLDSLLGKMIRIDVDGDDPYEVPANNPYVGKPGRDEIWASGLRNPWRWSFDGDLMFIGDVGQSAREEVDVVAVEPSGYDFGWSRFEGSLCNPDDHDPSCSTSGLTFPVAEYDHSAGQTVTGGVVYRGATVRSLQGFYLYADVYSGMVRGLRMNGDSIADHPDLSYRLRMGGIVHFGVDGDGEIVVANLFTGSIYRLVGG